MPLADFRSVESVDILGTNKPIDFETPFDSPAAERRSLLIIGEDDAALGSIINGLEYNDSGLITLASTGARAVDLLSQHSFDAIIIRNSLPDMCGRNLCRLIRRKRIHCPIIIVSDEEADADEIQALGTGATDFVSIQISPNVLAARLRAHVRQFMLSGRAKIKIGRFKFDPRRRRIVENCSPNYILLTGKENSLLMYICTANGKAVSENELLRAVWNYHENAYSTTVKTHIHNIRKKIFLKFTEERFLIYDQGGYRVGV